MSAVSYPPTIAVQRALLTQKRDQFRALGFECELDAETLAAQHAPNAAELVEQITNVRRKAANCYASARRLDVMLAELPPDSE